MKTEYAGRSLAYVRNLVGLPARYASAAQALDAVPPDDLRTGTPPEYAVTYYKGPVHGNIAFVVAPGRVITVDQEGRAHVYDYRDLRLGAYAGWSRTVGADPVPDADPHVSGPEFIDPEEADDEVAQ